MTELRDELARALRAVEPSPAPVETVMRRGRVIKARRRAAIALGALAVIGAVLGYPALAHQLAVPAPAPVQHQRDPVVTDVPPAPGSPAGLVAEGTIDAKPWKVTIKPDSDPGKVCLTGAGFPHSPHDSFYLLCGIDSGSGTDPASFAAAPESGILFELGKVAPDVTYFVLTFADGQQLKLIPVTVSGHRYVAYAAPLSMPVASVTAHLGTPHFDSGQTETATPFSQPGEAPSFIAWLRPGQPGLPRRTAKLGSGTVDGTPWSVSAYQGPWGICTRAAWTRGGFGDCAATPFTGTGLLGWSVSPMVVLGRAAANVAYLKITLSDGTALTVTPVRVGEQRLFAFAVPRQESGHWTAYSASGTRLASGSFGGS